MTHQISTKLKACLLASTLAIALPNTAFAQANICESQITDGAYTASLYIGEFYPGSELRRQTITITGTPEILPLETKSIKTPSGPVDANIQLELKNSLQSGAILTAGKWNELKMTMTLPRISAGTWYHKNCTIETENFILHKDQKIEGDYTNHCDLMLQDAQRNILEKENYIDYAFSGDDHWQPLTLRYDLVKLREFNAKVTKASEKQIADFAAGTCTLRPFS